MNREIPLLIRTLSTQHWDFAKNKMLENNSEFECAGGSKNCDWKYQVIRDKKNKNRVVLQTIYNDDIIKEEISE